MEVKCQEIVEIVKHLDYIFYIGITSHHHIW